MPEGDTLFRTAAGLRPYLVGRTVSAARTNGPGPVPQVARIVGHEIAAVEALGKNLLIRFDNGLEIRTHLRMNGSWHRYRPGRALAAAAVAGTPRHRGPGRGRGLLRCPGRRAPRTARRGGAPVARGARPGPARARVRRRGGRPPAARSSSSRDGDRRGSHRPAGAGRDRQRLQERDPVDRAGLAVRGRQRPVRRHARPARRDGPAVAARQRHARSRRRARDDVGRSSCAGTALRVRPGGPAVSPLPDADRQPRQGRDIPRTTYWCPACQDGRP